MSESVSLRAAEFLGAYRVLEGLLERRNVGKRQSSSVVMDYLKDEDSEPFRYELNLCREIRNLLSHNADGDGNPIVEPSAEILRTLQEIIEYVSRPRLAIEYGTPSDKIFCAHPNDRIIHVMHRMEKLGFSHVPVVEDGKLAGVFSVGSLFFHLEKYGLGSLDDDARISQIAEELWIERHGAEKYVFMDERATITQVRAAFEQRVEKNSRLSAVFLTKNGVQEEPLLAMLTPWDVLKDTTCEG